MVVTVAISEEWLLSHWWKTLRTDAIVATVLLCTILLLATVLFSQFRFRMKTERTLREREAHYRLLANNIADIIILIDARSLLRYVSHSVEPVLGLAPKDLLGKSCFDMIHPEDRESVRSATARLIGIDTVSTVVFRTWRADGTLAWVESKFKLAAEASDPAQTEFLCVIRDVTERKRMEDELTQLNRRLTQLAATDGLTGLTNRRTFDGFLLRQYESCEEISVLMLDIDSFKGYNDTYGHQAGDRCLQAVAKVIGDATSNTSGLSARYGGEEFAVVLPDTAEDAALKVAEAIRLTVRALGIPNSVSSRGYITISVGVASRTRSTLDEAALVGEADTALYEAKRLGRNRTVVYSSLDLQHVDSASIQHDDEFAPGERTHEGVTRSNPEWPTDVRLMRIPGSSRTLREVPKSAKGNRLRSSRGRNRGQRHIQRVHKPGRFVDKLHLTVQLLAERLHHAGAEASPGWGLDRGTSAFSPYKVKPVLQFIYRPSDFHAAEGNGESTKFGRIGA